MIATTSIDYDANHDRFRESDGSTTTYTIAGGLYEEIVSGSTSTQKSYIDGVIINTKVFNSGTLASNDTAYVHTDHLGSSEAISDKFGAFVNRMSFSDWGNRQKADWSTGAPALNFPTSNGYTGQHELDKHNLVHMGGRVYDPRIGRFLSADLMVQSPYSSQSYNRYSYVMNNPTGRIDPTGYCSRGLSTADTMMWSVGIQIYEGMHQAEIMDTMRSINGYEDKKAKEKAAAQLTAALNSISEDDTEEQASSISSSLSNDNSISSDATGSSSSTSNKFDVVIEQEYKKLDVPDAIQKLGIGKGTALKPNVSETSVDRQIRNNIRQVLKDPTLLTQIRSLWSDSHAAIRELGTLLVYSQGGSYHAYFGGRLSTVKSNSVTFDAVNSDYGNLLFSLHPHPRGTPVPSPADLNVSASQGVPGVLWYGLSNESYTIYQGKYHE